MRKLFELIIRHGIGFVFANVFLEQIGAPIPAVPTLIVAGALARDGRLLTTHVMIASIVASLIADASWFFLGRRYGYRILRTLCRISLSPDSCVRETESRFERWGLKSLVVAKFIPGFSTVAPPLAGSGRHSLVRFMIYDGMGAVLWAGAAVGVGRVFHRAVGVAIDRLETLGWWAGVVIAALLGAVIAVKWAQRLAFYRRLRMARVSVHELKEMIDRGEGPFIVDVRTASSHRSDPRRIPTAIVASADEIIERIRDLPPDREVILYCT